MSLLLSTALGLIAGLIVSRVAGRIGQGAVMDIVLGVVGAGIGGWLFNTFGLAAVGGFSIYSLLAAVVGASALLLVYYALVRGIREALFNLDLDLDNQS